MVKRQRGKQGMTRRAGTTHNRGRIELSALNSAFYARGRSPDLSAPPDGDVINVNCPNCTVIARCGRFLFLSLLLLLSFVSYPHSPHFLSSLTAFSTSHLLSFCAPAVSFSLFSSLAECKRLHLHLNLAVDLAVVRGHHSCRGKG